ncbi:MAG: NAD(P)-dependent oxidoreductase, partial [Candidatus Humimicrobiaceae bacterium]
AIPFGLKVYAYDPYVNESEIKSYKVEPASFEYIIKNCDYISLHVPLNSKTRHLIGEPELRSMKKDASLINTSRGAVVDEDMLVKALREDWIGGAGIDVFEKINAFDETEEKIDNPLFHLDNVILSPHCAACSDESLVEVKQKAIKEVVAVLSGRWPNNCVNPDVTPRLPLVR